MGQYTFVNNPLSKVRAKNPRFFIFAKIFSENCILALTFKLASYKGKLPFCNQRKTTDFMTPISTHLKKNNL
jgi:hypothetical protein